MSPAFPLPILLLPGSEAKLMPVGSPSLPECSSNDPQLTHSLVSTGLRLCLTQFESLFSILLEMCEVLYALHPQILPQPNRNVSVDLSSPLFL